MISKKRIDIKVFIISIVRLLFFLVCAIFLTNITNSYSFMNEDYYLWFEHDMENVKPEDPSSKPFFIYFGQRPNNKNNVSDLDDLEAFYTFGKKDAKGKAIYYKLNIIKIDNRFRVEVKSDKKQWCEIVLRGRRVTNNNEEYNYIAKTSFFFWGRSKNGNSEKQKLHKTRYGLPIWLRIPSSEKVNNKADNERYVLTEVFNKQFDVGITAERRNSARLIYYSPLKFTAYFREKPYNDKVIKIINEDGEIKEIKTNKNGEFSYVAGAPNPTNDLQELFLTEYIFGKCVYKSVYTVLFSPPPPLFDVSRKVDIRGGLGVFFVTFIFTVIITILLRIKFQP